MRISGSWQIQAAYAERVDALSAEGVSVRYGSRVAVHPIDLRVPVGRAVGIIGANGAGKTSLIEGCLGLRPLASGHVRVLGTPLSSALRHGLIGVMLQQGGVPGNATAVSWLRHVQRLFGGPARGSAAGLDALMERLGIDPRSRVVFKRLSGGEQQRVRLAAALLAPAGVLVLDEPSAGLDPNIRNEVLAMIGERREVGVGILLTTHRMDEIEGLFSTDDRVVVLAEGRIVEQGSVAEITGLGEAIRLLLDPQAEVTPDHLADLAARLAVVRSDAQTSSVEGPMADPRGQRLTIRADVSPRLVAEVMAWCAAHGLIPIEVRTDTRSLEQAMGAQPESRTDGPG